MTPDEQRDLYYIVTYWAFNSTLASILLGGLLIILIEG